MIPLFKPQAVDDGLEKAVLDTLKSGVYVKGPRVDSFEKKFSMYVGKSFGVGVNSGTTAIYLALRSIGISKGDKVIVPSHTFVGSASPILMLGAEPVFVDIDKYFTLDYNLLKEIKLSQVKAVLGVDLYGQTAENTKIESFCKKNNLFFIEDTAQAHGAEYQGRMAGSFGDFGCFSFFPTKNLSVRGDGGMVMTSDKKLNDLCKMFRDQGRDYSTPEGKFISTEVSMNFRMDELKATIGEYELTKLDEQNNKRINIARLYSTELKGIVKTPLIRKDSKHVFHQYVICVNKNDRKGLIDYLRKKDIQTGIHYPVPLHKQPIFSKFSTDLPITDNIVDEIISLPMYPELGEKDVYFVVEKIKEYFER